MMRFCNVQIRQSVRSQRFLSGISQELLTRFFDRFPETRHLDLFDKTNKVLDDAFIQNEEMLSDELYFRLHQLSDRRI